MEIVIYLRAHDPYIDEGLYVGAAGVEVIDSVSPSKTTSGDLGTCPPPDSVYMSREAVV